MLSTRTAAEGSEVDTPRKTFGVCLGHFRNTERYEISRNNFFLITEVIYIENGGISALTWHFSYVRCLVFIFKVFHEQWGWFFKKLLLSFSDCELQSPEALFPAWGVLGGLGWGSCTDSPAPLILGGAQEAALLASERGMLLRAPA